MKIKIRDYQAGDGIPTKAQGYLYDNCAYWFIGEIEDEEFNWLIQDPDTERIYQVMSIDFEGV